mgnify:CR=1 FL=1
MVACGVTPAAGTCRAGRGAKLPHTTQDVLSDSLRSVRLRGALYFHVDCTEPWVTEVPHSSVMSPAIMPESEHMMDYHVVIHGTCWAAVDGEAPVQLHRAM